jgi:hypothetical protein
MFRISTWFYRNTWRPWARLASHIPSQTRRESFLGYFGPLSLIVLLGLWACSLIFGFALLQFGSGAHLSTGREPITFGLLLYQGGETFFTLGYGDIVPASRFARALSVGEAFMGFAFLGVVIGYLPTIYSAFSRREIEISLLNYFPALPAAPTRAHSTNSSATGNDGLPKFWKATCRIRCSVFIARSTATSHGLARSPLSLMPLHW